MRAQIAPFGEALERAGDARKDARVVGVGAHEAQHLVQTQHLAGRPQRGTREDVESGALGLRRLRAELIAQAFQRAQGLACVHQSSASSDRPSNARRFNQALGR